MSAVKNARRDRRVRPGWTCQAAPGIVAVLLSLCWLASGIGALAQHGQGHDTGRHRNPADLKEYLEHLDSPDRDRDQKPQQVVEALGLKPGMAVADLGSGSGYFTRRFVQAVTDRGKVYAVDVEPAMLAYAKDSLEHLAFPYTAEFILGQPDDPKLPAASVDLVFVCNVYHHLEDRTNYFAKVRAALKDGGRIAIIDFYHDERSGNVGFPKRHLVAKEIVISEMAKAGYRLLREQGFLPRQYFLEFAPAP
jgi:ubiquinone/menaquinone biosynthesis C-methylase UbiE